MMPYRVLHILYTAQPEGAAFARIVEALARGLDPQRYRLHVWFMAKDGPLIGELGAQGVPARVQPWAGDVKDPRGAWRFWKSLGLERFAIVHVHFGGRSMHWLARSRGARVVLQVHALVDESRELKPIFIPGGAADLVIADCQAMADRVTGAPARVVYLGTGIPEQPIRREESSGPPPPTIIGAAARLVPVKGIEYLIRAFGLLHAEFPEAVLEIAGSGPMRSSLEELAQQLGLTNQVRFLGWLNDLARALARWDIYVLSSIQDGFPIAVLEAMGAGLPVVASNVGGLGEMLEDGRTGWLVRPADPPALADRLRALLANPDQRRAMGVAGRARAQDRFSEKGMAEAVGRVYNELLGL